MANDGALQAPEPDLITPLDQHRVWKSDDATNWKLQPEALLGFHGDVVVSGNLACGFTSKVATKIPRAAGPK